MKKQKIKYRQKSFFSILFHKPLFFIFLLLSLPFLIWGVRQSQQVTSFGKGLFPQASYGTIDPLEGYPGGDPPPEQNPDLNPLVMRGYVPGYGELYPIDLSNGIVGEKTPQIGKILDNVPKIISIYRINSWVGDFRSGRRGVPMPVPDDPAASVKQIQMIGLETSPGQPIKVPPVYGNPISPEYNAMVLFANDNFITLKYTREDNIGIRNGYAIQIDGIAPDTGLLSLYNQLNASGRRDLPAVSNEQVIGTASSNEIRVIIRDTGDFLDPRSKLDWWQGIDYPYQITSTGQNPTIPVQPTQPIMTYPSVTATQPTAIPRVTVPTTPVLPTAIVTVPVTQILPTPTSTAVVITQPTISAVTPTPTPPFLSKLKSSWDNLLNSIIKFTKVILP